MRSALFTGAAVGFLALSGCATSDKRLLDSQWLGKQAPDFALVTNDGQNVRLSDYRGKPMILAFWAHG